MYVVKRYNKGFDEAANELTEQMFSFVQQSRRERISQRNKTESASVEFDWKNLSIHYDRAYRLAIERR
jgi:glycogen(starch) synthase